MLRDMHARAMNLSLPSLQRAFSCLAHESRLRIVLALLERPRFVTELASEIALSQSCTTRHLQVLSGAGLVRGVRHGKRVVFEVVRDAPLLAALRSVDDSPGGEVDEGAVGRSLAITDPPNRSAGMAPVRPTRAAAVPRKTGGDASAQPGSDRAEAAPTRSRTQDLEDFLL